MKKKLILLSLIASIPFSPNLAMANSNHKDISVGMEVNINLSLRDVL